MPQSRRKLAAVITLLRSRQLAMPLAIVLVQCIAAGYFIFDGIDDLIAQAREGIDLGIVMECMVAVALFGGAVISARHVGQITRELKAKEQTLASARGALAEHIALRFAQWELTPGEREVALFALKGCDVAEIARLRSSASGTVRSQLSQVYAKARVSSQAMLVSLFIEDLLDISLFG